MQPGKDNRATGHHLCRDCIPGNVSIAAARNLVPPSAHQRSEKREMGVLTIDADERLVQLGIDLELG